MKRLLLKMCLCLPLLALFACEEDEPAVSLSAPNITNVEVVNDNSVSITWTAVPGAAWYELYRSTNAVDFAYLKRVDGMTSAIDYSPANGKTNYYKVKAANSSTSSPMSAAKSIMVDDNQSGSLVAPTGVEARVSGNSIFLSWTDVPTANKYNVYRCSTANGVYSLLTTTSQTSVTDNSPLSGSNYYKVRSVAANGGISEYSTYAYVNYTSGGGTEEPDEPETLPAPTGVQAYQAGNNIRVEWRAVSGASRYQVYYKGPGYGSYSFANTVHTYIDLTNNLKDGNWSFYVIALDSDYEKGEKSSTVSCRYTSSGGATPGGGGEEEPSSQQLATPTGLSVDSRAIDMFVQISFDEVPLAYKYELYRATSAGGYYRKVTAIGGGSQSGGRYCMTDQNPLDGTSYYKVKAIPLSYLGIEESELSSYVRVSR